MRTSCTLLLVSVCATPAVGQDFDFTVDSAASTSSIGTGFTLGLPSTVIGDFDTVTNPTGTRTLPGLFGGSGNIPIPMTLALSQNSLFSGAASGSFGLSVDEGALTVEMDSLVLDLLNGGTGSADLILSMLFDTFRTIAPDSLYIGIPIDLPLGTSTISDLFLTQSGPAAPGVMIPGAGPGEYDMALSVPVDLSFILDFGGQQTPVGPTPLLLPVVAALTLNGSNAVVDIDVALVDSQSIPDPIPGFAITDQPLPLPTILPPGFTANLLLSATISHLDIDTNIQIDLSATGSVPCFIESYCDSVTNSTGLMATMTITGSTQIADEQLQVDVVDLPLHKSGLFFMSESAVQIPTFGGGQGTLCAGPPQLRFTGVVNSGATGTVSLTPDFQNLPQGAVFLGGSTWHFQLWYRDLNPSNTSNTSNGVRVLFCN